MKKILFVLALIAIGAKVDAAVLVQVGSVSKSTTSAEDNAVLALVQAKDAENCVAIGLAAICSQAQYDGSSLARPGVTIYPRTAAGAMQYVLDLIFSEIDTVVPAQQVQISQGAAQAAWIAASPAQQQAACTALGKDATTCK